MYIRQPNQQTWAHLELSSRRFEAVSASIATSYLNSAQQLNYSKQKALQAHMRVLHESICVAPANNNK